MSTAEGITVVAPEPADMQRDVEVQTRTPLLAPRHDEMQRGPCDSIAVYVHDEVVAVVDDFRQDCNDGSTWDMCIRSCAHFLICHALGELILEIFCFSRFLPCLCSGFREFCESEEPEQRNRTVKLFAFLAKILSNLWVTTLLVLYIQWAFFRPIDVKPRLGTAAIHVFDLQQADAAAMADTPHLRFNLTACLLFKNTHTFNINYDNLAVSVLYAGEKLGPVDDELPSFKTPDGSTLTPVVLVGQLRNASSTVAEMFSADRDKGLLEMVVRIRVTLAYKFWPLKEEYFNMYDCPLSSLFPQTGEPAFSSPAWCKTIDV